MQQQSAHVARVHKAEERPMDAEWMALSDAALTCGLNRERLLRLVQAGVIEGRRNITGRWEVRRCSLEHYRQAGEEAAAAGPRQVSRG